MEHTNSLNGVDVSAECLLRPLLTYLMNHFQQTTPTNNNDLSCLNGKQRTEERNLMKINLEMNEMKRPDHHLDFGIICST